jgi:hypothetical protein
MSDTFRENPSGIAIFWSWPPLIAHFDCSFGIETESGDISGKASNEADFRPEAGAGIIPVTFRVVAFAEVTMNAVGVMTEFSCG